MESNKQDEFLLFENRKYPSITEKDSQTYLMKWSMKGRLKTVTCAFDRCFVTYHVENLFKDFFSSHIGQSFLGEISNNLSVKIENVKCSLKNTEIFRKLEKVTYSDGRIKKRLDEVYDSILISDQLRECLLLEDADTYEIFSTEERDEFLFRLFKHVCIGGEVCQQEEYVKPYIEFSRKLYRDLISVQKNPETKNIEIISHVYHIQVYDGHNLIFPSDIEHPNTFAYIIVDPYKRNLIMLYHVFGCGEMI